ncbi:MAG TPA: cation:proton antiporter, partial [Burkholderiales bacterium]|nr:cation:proton antiporter [Burkholderiales bacterium]
ASGMIKRAPISLAMIYLAIGWLFGRSGWVVLDPGQHAKLLETLAEIAVIVSLFSAGLKLRVRLRSPIWRLPIALATVSMAIAIGMMTFYGVAALALPIGVAVLLGSILAPTDPVLAADVQVSDPGDTDALRFALTGEAGFNDGSAFPFVIIGLGLIGLHDFYPRDWHWWTFDVVWPVAGGLVLGALLGWAIGRLVVYLRRRHLEAVGYDDFLALGLIASSYGLAIALHANGFLAVFATGLALRTVERELTGKEVPSDMSQIVGTDEEIASDDEHAPAYLAAAVLSSNEQLERIGQLTLVVITGALLSQTGISLPAIATALFLFLIVRPLSVGPFAMMAGMTLRQATMVSWFGIRGVGSLYYLFHVMNRGLPADDAAWMMHTVLCIIAASVVLHGISVTPLMRRYANDAAPENSSCNKVSQKQPL